MPIRVTPMCHQHILRCPRRQCKTRGSLPKTPEQCKPAISILKYMLKPTIASGSISLRSLNAPSTPFPLHLQQSRECRIEMLLQRLLPNIFRSPTRHGFRLLRKSHRALLLLELGEMSRIHPPAALTRLSTASRSRSGTFQSKLCRSL